MMGERRGKGEGRKKEGDKNQENLEGIGTYLKIKNLKKQWERLEGMPGRKKEGDKNGRE